MAVRSMFEGQPEAVARRCSVDKVFLNISKKSQENTCVPVSFLIMLRDKACNFIEKETHTNVISCEFCEIFKNTFLLKTPPVCTSGRLWRQKLTPKVNRLFRQHFSLNSILLRIVFFSDAGPAHSLRLLSETVL